MRQLPEQFRKNELPYTLIKRNDVVALYGVGGTYTDKILHYEVCQIHHRPERIVQGRSVSAREVLPKDDQFGRDLSRAIVNQDEALAYFDEITIIIKDRRRGREACHSDNRTSKRYQSAALQSEPQR